MKLPSLIKLAQDIKHACNRFPLAVLSAVIGTIAAICLIEKGEIENDMWLFNVALVSALGLTTFTSVQILSERTHISKLLLIFCGFAFLGLMYWSLPDSEFVFNSSVPYIRYAVFNAIGHLLVATVPYFRRGELNGFWNYNKALFLRIITTLFYSGVIYLGIAMALGALNVLFDADIKGERFAECFVIIVGVFNTLFFLAGVPENFKNFNDKNEYPKGLKVFTQFILLPLLTLYLVILYAYGTKIIVLADWPQGIVSYMVSVVSVLGILTLLLVYPISLKGENVWIRLVYKYYYIVLIPLVCLLFLAVGMRIQDYGITINRYLIVLLGIWLLSVCVYFIAIGKNIKFIPISLMIMLFCMSFGPWGVFSVSERSQINRLGNILSEAEILLDGKIRNEMELPKNLDYDFYEHTEFANNELISDSVKNEVKSIVDYLDDFHSFEGLVSFFNQDVNGFIADAKKLEENRYLNEARVVMYAMGLEYKYAYKTNYNKSQNYTMNAIKPGNVVDNVSEVDYVVKFNFHNSHDSLLFEIDNDSYMLRLSESDSLNLSFHRNESLTPIDIASIIENVWDRNSEKHYFQIEAIRYPINLKGRSVEFVFDRIYFQVEPKFKVKGVSGTIRFKKSQ